MTLAHSIQANPEAEDHEASRRRLPWQISLLVVAIGAALVVKALTLRLTTMEQMSFVMVVVVATVGMLGPALARSSPVFRGAIFFWALLMVLQLGQMLYPSVGQSGTSKTEAGTDFVVMVLPWLLVGCLYAGLRTRAQAARMLVWLWIPAVAAAMLSWLVGPETGFVRFRSPPILAITIAWALALGPISYSVMDSKHARAIQLTARAAVVLLLPIAVGSQSRTALLIWLACGAFVLFRPGLPGQGRTPRLALVGLLACASLLVPSVQQVISGQIPGLMEQVRLSSVASGELDASSAARVEEVLDVVATVRDEGNWADQLLGFGHGATYWPRSAAMSINADPISHRVHNVHNTIALVYLRYGLIGIAAYVLLMASIIIQSLRGYRRNKDSLSIIVLLSVGAFSLDAMMRNSFADPTFALVVATAVLINRLRSHGGSRDAWA